jgi:hypothetical protein
MFTTSKSFKYPCCQISYENEKDIQQKRPKFAQIMGILKHFYTDFGPEVYKNLGI